MSPRHLVSALVVAALVSLLFLAGASPAGAGSIDREFPFELDKWYELEVTDGPVTIHRVRVERLSGNVKSRVFRGSNTEFLETVQIQVEYTNDADRDYDADLDIVWVDSQGREIDGYRDDEGIDEESHDEMTAALSTSKYGLEVAKTLRVKIDF